MSSISSKIIIAMLALALASCSLNIKPLGFAASLSLAGIDTNGQVVRVSIPQHETMIGNGTSPPITIGPSTNGKVFTSQGPASDPDFLDPISSDINEIVCSVFNITSATNQATGCSITLPFAGTWTVEADDRYTLFTASNTGSTITALFHNDSTGLDISSSQRISTPQTSATYNTTGEIHLISKIITSGSEIIEIYAHRNNGVGTLFTTSSIGTSDANGSSVIRSQQFKQ